MKPVVLQLIDSFHQGGSERQALQLTRLLHDSGSFRVRLACLSSEGVLRKEIEDLDLGVIPAYPLTRFYDLNALAQLRRFTSFLSAAQVDVLHSHDFYTNVFGMFAGALARVPVRVASRRETTGMRSGAQQKAQGIAYKLAHQVLGNSEAVRRQLIAERVPANKIGVVYNGLDLDRFAPRASLTKRAALAVLNLPVDLIDRPLVSIVANMRLEVKDHPLFLRAMRRVHHAIPTAGFLLAGEGELLPSIRQQAVELGLEADAFFLGGCSQLAELLTASQVCVLSSKSEGFSNSILEYMAAARPVVATDVGGAREVIMNGETGYLVPAGDDTAMAERVISLIRDTNTARAMGEAGRRIVAERFSRETQLRRTENMYEQLLKEAHIAQPAAVEGIPREIV